ncbi:MAG: acetyl-CoA C-acyltransferase [Proteobacteria bacterium]|nr:acetyl-CoA C-acyltransferase [Pseudomonadota bacterium]
MSVRAVYIVSPYRSAVGKAKRGSLAHTRPDDLCSDVVTGVLKRTPSLDPALIEDVIVGCAMPEAEQGMNVGRVIALLSGLPYSVPGFTVNRLCASGLQSIALAADRIASGGSECILAGGTESMSMVPMMGNKPVGSLRIAENYPSIYLSMGLTAEKVSQKYQVSREEQDQFAFHSHRKALRAMENHDFDEEILPITVKRKTAHLSDGSVQEETMVFDKDEGPRADTNLETLAKLRAVFLRGGVVSAGTSSQMSDGAAMCLVCSEAFVKTHNLAPMARFAGFAVAGVPPQIMGIGPMEAIPKALKKAGINQDQLERIELNEAFAAQSIAVINILKLNPEMVNPTGGAIALGHPLGATGARLTSTLLHGLKRQKQKWGMVTMCIGTGMGAAGVFESLV